MRPVYQDEFGDKNGNCFKACVASVFEIDLEQVPSFGWSNNWYDLFADFIMESRGLYPIDIDCNDAVFIPKGYHFISGLSPRDLLHSVVGLNGEMVHDPHPSGDGLVDKQTYTLFIAPLVISIPCTT